MRVYVMLINISFGAKVVVIPFTEAHNVHLARHELVVLGL